MGPERCPGPAAATGAASAGSVEGRTGAGQRTPAHRSDETKAPAAELSAKPANLPPPAIPGDVAPTPGTPVSVNSAALTTQVQEPAASPDDNPEKSAQSFVERNQKEAEAHLKALTAEAEQLRARLTRLESGIKRWQVLVNALRSAQGVAAADEPSTLEPVPQTSPGGPRADKKVKWTSANPAPASTTATNQRSRTGPTGRRDRTAFRACTCTRPCRKARSAGAPGVVPR